MDSAASSCQPVRHSYLSCSWLVMNARKPIAPKATAKMIFSELAVSDFEQACASEGYMFMVLQSHCQLRNRSGREYHYRT